MPSQNLNGSILTSRFLRAGYTKIALDVSLPLTSYATRSRSTGIPVSTLWRRANSKPSIADKAAKQLYLTPQEEQALVHSISKTVYPLDTLTLFLGPYPSIPEPYLVTLERPLLSYITY
jgi:hypothetical protein